MIPYLVGNETASATYMNALYSEFDAKFTKLMAGGKSFFLAQNAALPAKFSGKAFFFTTGRAVYARNVFGWVDSGGGLTRPYNHSQFTNAVAAINPALVTWDEVNKVALVPAFPASMYAGLPNAIELTTQKPVGTGLLDWSLQAHTILHKGASDTAPVPYYIQEASVGVGLVGSSVAPEKHYRFCLAEIIIEGPSSVTLPVTFDKYSCFRIHNFNSTVTTLKFVTGIVGADYVVTLQPYAVATMRRDPATSTAPPKNYRAGYNYFFKFEGGDPRFYWFAPKAYQTVGNVGLVAGDGPVMTNSMQANNLTNPALLLDWVNYFIRDLGPGQTGAGALPRSALDQNGFYAGWQQDAGVQADIASFYKNVFGGKPDPDPTKSLIQPTTLLGDLIHHQGDIMIIRSSKTQNDRVTGKPVVVVDKVTFKGYATIIADFAAKQLTVVENGAGDLTIANADAANNVFLVPYGTNLLKTGENHPTIFSLVGKSFTIENAIFENPDALHLSSTAPQLIFQPAATFGSTSKTWNTWDAATGFYDIPQTLTGNPQTTLNWATNRSTAKVLHGIHKTKVSDLLTLDWWGDPSKPGQNSSFVTITNQKLTLTPEGLVITYTETDSAAYAPSDANWLNLKRGVPTVKSIAFRSHGFGYFSTANGSRDTGWLTGRAGRYQFAGAYQNDFVGPAGQDFQVQGEPTQATVSVLGRLKLAGTTSTVRFFGTTPNDSLLKFLQNAGGDNRIFGALFAASSEFTINGGTAPVVTGAVSPIAMALLPEMYNGLARAVNAINRASPLSWKCLRWNVFGKSVGLSTAVPFELFFTGTWDPNTNTTSNLSGISQDTGSLQSGVGVPGFYYQAGNSGSTPLDGNSGWVQGDVATFTPAGVWVKTHGLPVPQVIGFWAGFDTTNGYSPYAGIVPMSCFASFDPGSQFESLCHIIGIPVRTAADMPGAASGQSLSALQNTFTANGIILDEITCVAGTGSLSGSSSPFTASATIAGTIISDLLSATSLINGQGTGTQCLGTWSDGLLQAGSSNLVAAGYGDIGRYWVVPDDATLTAGVWSSKLGGIKRGDLVMINQFSGDPSSTLYGVITVVAMTSFLNKQKGATISGFDLNTYSNVPAPFGTTGGGIRWITISDVRAAVERFGFQFSYIEQCIPMSLYYFEQPYTPNVLYHQARGAVGATALSGFGAPSSAYIPSAFSILIGPDARLGNYSKFVITADAGALWKSKNFGPVFGLNPIADVNPIAGHSPIVNAISGHMVFDPSLQVGAAPGAGTAQPGNGQFLGPAPDSIGTAIGEPSTYFIGYKITVYDPKGTPDIVNQVSAVNGGLAGEPQINNGFELNQTYFEGLYDRQFFTQAFFVQNSAAFQAFPLQVVLVAKEIWMRPPSWWTQSLFNANWYIDFASNGPWQYLGASGSQTIALGNGVTVIAPPGRNTFYTMLSGIGAPVVAL